MKTGEFIVVREQCIQGEIAELQDRIAYLRGERSRLADFKKFREAMQVEKPEKYPEDASPEDMWSDYSFFETAMDLKAEKQIPSNPEEFHMEVLRRLT